LPGMSGEDALQILKSNPELKRIPVIVFSNIDKEEDVKKMKQLGAADFFLKASTEINQLVDAVRTHIGE
jgi:CheY-like chemotaxis protein